MPCPDVGDKSEIQPDCVDAVHAHSGWVVMVTVPLPPFASSAEVAFSATWHLSDVGAVVAVEEEEQAAPIPATPAMTSAIGAYRRTNRGGVT